MNSKLVAKSCIRSLEWCLKFLLSAELIVTKSSVL